MGELVTTDKSWKPIFLEVLREHGVVSEAAKKAEISRWTVYNERKIDPQFKAEWDAALELGLDALEDAAKKRAFTISDTLLIFLLKANRPEKYREVTKNIQISVTPEQIQAMSDDELDALINKLTAGTR